MRFITIDWFYRKNASKITFNKDFMDADSEAQLDALQDAMSELEQKYKEVLASTTLVPA
jgi:hypothetical protein|tara:strand:+ start:765 stop:941 length:177 start_codon:yes stop_codon:yes gene_type:complete